MAELATNAQSGKFAYRKETALSMIISRNVGPMPEDFEGRIARESIPP